MLLLLIIIIITIGAGVGAGITPNKVIVIVAFTAILVGTTVATA